MIPTLDAQENRRLGELASRVFVVSALVGLVALGGAVLVGFMMTGEGSWQRFFKAYLLGFMFILSISLGGLFFTMLQHLTRAGWSVVVRRIAEGLAANFLWIWVLFIPIAVFGAPHLFGWWKAEKRLADPIYLAKEAFLNPGFWSIRAVIYFAVWAALGWFFFRSSVEQDETGEVQLTKRMQTFAAPGMILFAVTLSFAAIDWMMALEAHWFSTMYGVYYFACSACAFFASIIIILHILRQTGRVTTSITTEHFHDLGNGLFAFGIVFWAYIAFSQYMLIWYANIPEETTWYAARQIGGWDKLSIFLLLGHFAGPFLLLISRYPKRNTMFLAGAAAWMLFMHAVDLYYLIMPVVPHDITQFTTFSALAAAHVNDPGPWQLPDILLDFMCVGGMVAIYIAMTARRLGNVSLIPLRDPRMNESLAFENF